MGFYNFIRAVLAFTSLKLLFWGIGLVLLSDSYSERVVHMATTASQEQLLAFIMIPFGIIGVSNTFWQRKKLKIILATVYSIFWLYALLCFTPHHVSFYRTLPESVLIWMSLVVLVFRRGDLSS